MADEARERRKEDAGDDDDDDGGGEAWPQLVVRRKERRMGGLRRRSPMIQGRGAPFWSEWEEGGEEGYLEEQGQHVRKGKHVN